ncbi:MAG: glycosyltransferase family 2 protein [Phycisphaerae bacterium]|jgi:hyaluronan synthase|nr:glycosyltransferase family 2 protein [Phycisphaerae bacterium]
MTKVVRMVDVYSSLRPKGYPRDFVPQSTIFYEYFKANINFYGKVMMVLSLLILFPIALSTFHAENLVVVKTQLRSGTFGSIFLFMGQFFLIVNIIIFGWRVYLYAKYRPEESCTDDELMVCTVIVPAYNEGQQVWKTLQSLVASDYPAEKLEIIAVDDGSADDTWYWIQKAAAEYPDRIRALRQPRNMGKRHALYEGFLQGRGEVFVTVDSDSLVDPQTIRLLLSPMVRNPKVGGMAGNVRVLNRDEGLLPIMQDVRFMYSFEFMRASQSMVDTVICTPGALSAYRRSVVMKVLPEWMNQTFLGRTANIGEDRAMTNLILREGYYVRFQRNAKVYTNVPTTYKGTCKMFLRWARSNFRETLVMGKFIFKKFRETPVKGARINFLLQVQTLTISQVFLVTSFLCLLWKPWVFAVTMLTGIAIRSVAPAALYYYRTRSSDALWAYWYGVIWVLGFSWITPYAMFTLRKNGWLTRQLPQENQATTQPPMFKTGLAS